MLSLKLEDGLAVLGSKRTLDESLRPQLGITYTRRHARVGGDETVKFGDDQVRGSSHICILHLRDLRAIQAADSEAHLRAIFIGRRKYIAFRLVGFAVFKMPEDGGWKEVWSHGRRICFLEEIVGLT